MTNTGDTPALLGGPPTFADGPPTWPCPDADVERALRSAYQDGTWGQYNGPHVETLESELCSRFGVDHALTCGSGTFAVELALRALKVTAGDEVILASYDFPGNFLAVHALGAHPVLVDLDRDNWNLDPSQLEAALSDKVRAILVSHLHGGLVPMREVLVFAREHEIGVVEDAAQAPGASIGGKPVGSWGDVGVLSFGGSKLLSGGRGGALLTSRGDIYHRSRRFQNRGNLVAPLSELQAAVLLPQLAKLDERTAKRVHSVHILRGRLDQLPGVRVFRNRAEQPVGAYYKLGIQYDAEEFGMPRPLLVRAMRAEGVALDEGFAALHRGRSPSRFRGVGTLPESNRAHRGTLILHHPILLESRELIELVADAWEKVYRFRDEIAARVDSC